MGKELRSYGANVLFVSSGTESFSTSDFEEVKKLIPKEAVVGLTPFKYQNIKINRQPFVAAGTDFEELKKTSPYWYVTGEYPESKGEALIGQNVAETIGLANGKDFTVSGINAEGEPFDRKLKVSGILQTGGNEEDCIYVNMSDVEEMSGERGLLDIVEASISSGSEDLESLIRTIRRDVPSVSPSLVKRVTQSEGTVLGKLQALVYIVTIIVLILTMVCVATTMMAVVAERRREIGLKKALGASNKEIIWEFLGEGLFLGAFGGLIGVILGYFFAQAVSISVFTRGISFNPLIIPLTILVSVLVTGIACVLPVRSATDVDPALVLRGE